jgi:hypothetical protein
LPIVGFVVDEREAVAADVAWVKTFAYLDIAAAAAWAVEEDVAAVEEVES